MPRIPSKTFLTGFRFRAEKICLAKNTCIRLQDKYSRKLYPVCPILQEVIGKEKPSITKVPKTNFPLLDSIIKILVVFEGLMQLRPDLETVVWCVHSENFLKERIDLIRHDLSALPQWLEKDFPPTSKECKEFVAQLDLAELRYTMHSNSLVYFLPDDIEYGKYGNWATVIEWRERQIKLAERNGLSDVIEMNRLTCHYPAEAIKAINKIYDELRPLVKILSEQVKQSKREKIEQSQILAGFLQTSAGTKLPSYLCSKSVLELITQGESHTLEFKETLQYNIHTKQSDKDILHSSLKTIAAFMNADGGTLLIGVSDTGQINGIDRDIRSLGRNANNDRFELKIRNCISGQNSRFNPAATGNINISFLEVQEGTICRVDVQPLPNSVVLHFDNEVYLRDGNRTIKLEGPALTNWIRQRSN